MIIYILKLIIEISEWPKVVYSDSVDSGWNDDLLDNGIRYRASRVLNFMQSLKKMCGKRQPSSLIDPDFSQIWVSRYALPLWQNLKQKPPKVLASSVYKAPTLRIQKGPSYAYIYIYTHIFTHSCWHICVSFNPVHAWHILSPDFSSSNQTLQFKLWRLATPIGQLGLP